MKNILSFILISLFVLNTEKVDSQLKTIQNPAEGEENLNVLSQWIRWNNPGSLLINHLIAEADNHYSLRDKEIAGLKNANDWWQRQEHVKKKLNELVGPFPSKNPLNPRVTGVIRKKCYRIEKVIYESMPEYYVTGCLFVPDGIKGKAPAVLNVIGHSQESFRAELYQTVIHNLVKKGIIVFAIDTPGQGEHVQYHDPAINFSSVGYSVIEHCYFGNQCFLTGSSAVRYFIREGIRSIDYLLSLKYVDPGRIGVTGFPGGGTHHLYEVGFSWGIAGVMKGYDLPDLIACISPRKIVMTDMKNQMLEPVSDELIKEEMVFPLSLYNSSGAGENLRILSGNQDMMSLINWCIN